MVDKLGKLLSIAYINYIIYLNRRKLCQGRQARKSLGSTLNG